MLDAPKQGAHPFEFIYFGPHPQNGRRIKHFYVLYGRMQCMTADCQACHITVYNV